MGARVVLTSDDVPSPYVALAIAMVVAATVRSESFIVEMEEASEAFDGLICWILSECSRELMSSGRGGQPSREQVTKIVDEVGKMIHYQKETLASLSLSLAHALTHASCVEWLSLLCSAT